MNKENLVDLKELSSRESERTEWKENVADINSVVKTIVAFANDISNLGGGYVVCGAKEVKDETGFQKFEAVGLTSDKIKEIEGAVLAHCREKVHPPIIPVTNEISLSDVERRIFVFIITTTGQAHSYRSGGKDASTYYVRIGRETREARDGILREFLVQKNVLEPWDRRVNETAQVKDIDLLALRDYLEQMGLWDSNKQLEDYISDTDRLAAFIPPLAGLNNQYSEPQPRNFTILMFSDPIKFFPGAYSIFSAYKGHDRSEPTSEKHEILGPAVRQAERIIELLNVQSYTAIDKDDSAPNALKYPPKAIREAVVNALAHRSYESDQPVRVTVFSDRIEINSPGGLPRPIIEADFKKGKSFPYWRNQSLAYFFNKLHLAQSEGQGIPTIFRTMSELGCPEPEFKVSKDNLLCVLPAHPRHQLMREIIRIESQIILGNRVEALEKLEELLNKDPYNFRLMELYCEVNNLLDSPKRLYDFITNKNLKYVQFNSSSLIAMAETLSLIKDGGEARELVEKFSSQAVSNRLTDQEIKKIAINYRKIGEDEKSIEFIDNILNKDPFSNQKSTLLEIRGKAKIDLAKKCMETANGRSTSARFKVKAWDQCRNFLNEAESNFQEALGGATDEIEREFIVKDLQFLESLRQIAKKPAKRSKEGFKTRKKSFNKINKKNKKVE